MTVSRLRPYATTVFAEMSALAARIGAVNLGQGFPDEDGPPAMLEAAQEAIADGVNQYPPGIGIAPLRHAIAAQRQRRYGIAYDPDTEVLVTVGATEAIASAVIGLVEPAPRCCSSNRSTTPTRRWWRWPPRTGWPYPWSPTAAGSRWT